LLKQERETHSESLMSLFNTVLNPIESTTFENRISSFKKRKM
jgi:hypothetical protein